MAVPVPLAATCVLEMDPVLAAIASAPVDETPETEEERAVVEEGMAAIRAGSWVQHQALPQLPYALRRMNHHLEVLCDPLEARRDLLRPLRAREGIERRPVQPDRPSALGEGPLAGY